MRTPLLLALALATTGLRAAEVPEDRLRSAFGRAGDNAAELRAAFAGVGAEEAEGLAFLIEHMPARDLTTLKAEYLVANVTFAYRARAAVPWGAKVPDELFFNDVLPYASINERRDNWRADFYERFLPLVEGCETPGEAAQVLNRDMWDIVGVRYNARQRPKPDQSPYESMEVKVASCSGLSVLLIDACRAVCVPARFVGTPMWTTKRGNHSWVEVWDGERWQFTGAGEYDAGGLGRGWFAGDAAKAVRDDPRHAIYATSWRPAGTRFPLIWDLRIGYVQAENVTDRYTGETGKRVFLQLFGRPGGGRVAADVEVWRGGEKVGAGRTRDASNDTNDMLGLPLEGGVEYRLKIARPDGEVTWRTFTPSGDEDEQIEFFLGE